MLRLQNKYRNTLKKDPARIAQIATELGMDDEAEKLTRQNKPYTEKAIPDRDFLRRRLESEINALYDRLARTLKDENERLRAENAILKEELSKKN